MDPGRRYIHLVLELYIPNIDSQSLSIPTRAVMKWNRGVVEALVTSLRTKCTVATNEMAEKMQALVMVYNAS